MDWTVQNIDLNYSSTNIIDVQTEKMYMIYNLLNIYIYMYIYFNKDRS